MVTIKIKKPICKRCGRERSINPRNKTGLCMKCNWYKEKPESTNYYTLHWRVRERDFGNPKVCESCGAKFSRNKAGRSNLQWAKISKEYTDNREDYIGLCVTCHLKFDGLESRRNPLTGRFTAE